MGQREAAVKKYDSRVIADSIGLEAGFRDGDQIVAINKKPIQYANDISKNFFLNTDVNVTVKKDGRGYNINITRTYYQ